MLWPEATGLYKTVQQSLHGNQYHELPCAPVSCTTKHCLLTSAAGFRTPRLCRRRIQYKCAADGAVTTSFCSGPNASNGMSLAHSAVHGRLYFKEGLCSVCSQATASSSTLLT